MKKILIFILVFAVFPLVAHAKDDVVIVENMKTYVIVGDSTNYSKDDTFKVNVIFGSNPNTGNFTFKIPKKGEYIKYGTKKAHKYNIQNSFYGLLDEEKKYIYSIDSDNDFDIMYMGRENELLHENEEFVVSYEVDYKSYDIDEHNLILANSEYVINKTNFEVVLPDNALNMKYLFSIDGKNFSDKLDGIDYDITYGKMNGVYDRKLNVGSALYLKMIPDYSVYKNVIVNIIVYSIISIVSIYCIFRITKYFKENK